MKTTGVKDVPKKILLVFLGHPSADEALTASPDVEENGENGNKENR